MPKLLKLYSHLARAEWSRDVAELSGDRRLLVSSANHMRIQCKTSRRLGLATQQGVITVVIVVVLLLFEDLGLFGAEEFVPVISRGPVIRFAYALVSECPVVGIGGVGYRRRKCCDSRTTHTIRHCWQVSL